MKYTNVYAPVTGYVQDITTCSDVVFAQKLVGDGVVIKPKSQIITSPCHGRITHLFKTNHALTIEDDFGTEILIHLGIDTVELNGKGFKKLITDIHQTIEVGEPLIEMDLNYIQSQHKDTDILVILSNGDKPYKFKKYLDQDKNMSDILFKYKY